MLPESRNLRLRQVDQSLAPWREAAKGSKPKGGWVKGLREALGMTTTQLGERMGLSRQSVSDLEKREAGGTVTLNFLERAAEALDADLVYAIVPRRALGQMRERRACAQARQQLERAAHTMRLEDQGVSRSEFESQLKEVQERLLREWGRRFWDETRTGESDG